MQHFNIKFIFVLLQIVFPMTKLIKITIVSCINKVPTEQKLISNLSLIEANSKDTL